MEIEDKHKIALKILNSSEKLNNDLLETLLENCCRSLSGKKENNDILNPSDSSVREFEKLYASLLYVYAQGVRNSLTKEEFSNFLCTECNLHKDKVLILEDFYEKWEKVIRIQLLNIGSHLPHVTDVRWKIDYTVKSNALEQSFGPIFRVSLKTEKFDESSQRPKIEFIDFTCTSQELQDLVYKLKDAVRHCHKMATEH